MNFTGIDFTIVPDNSFAYIAFDLQYGYRLLEERRDANAVYFRDLEDADPDGVSNTAVTTQGLIINSSLVAYNGSLGPLEDRVGELIKIGDTWATVLLYNSDRSVVVDNYPTKLPPIQSIENNLINVPLHGLANNDPIQFSGPTPPIGITEGTTYYVRNPTTNSFNISATSGGSNITLVDRAGELYVSKLYSVFLPTLNYDVTKDTIIGKVIRTGNFYNVETFYSVSGESLTSFEIVGALPTTGAYEGQVVLYENTIFTWNGISWVTASGESSITVSLSVTQQAFDYTSNGNLVGTPTSTVTATAFGASGALTYVFKVDGNVLSGTGNTRTYTPNSTDAAMPDIVTVDLFEDGLLVASDLITMFGVTAGGDAVTIILSNEAHTVPTDSAGNNGVFTGSGTTIKVFRGNTPLNYVSGGTTSSFDVSFTSTQVAGGAITGSGTATATIGDLTSISASTGRRDITVTVYFDGVTSVFSKVQSFSRSLAGAAGAANVIYYVDSSASAIKRNLDGTLTPSTVTFSAFSITGNNSPVAYAGRFIVRRNGTAVYTSAANEATYVYTPATPSSLTDVKVELYLAGGTTTLLDQETLPVVQDGSSAITVSVDNDNVSFAGPVTGYAGIVFGSATSTTRVYRGATLLSYATSGANTWNVTAQSSTGVTVATPTGSGTTYVVPVPTAMSADSAFTDLTITVRDEAGAASTFNARITYSLSRAGAAGGNGLNNAVAYLYQRAATAPVTAPAGTFTYTFATGVLSGGTLNGYSFTIPAANGNPLWVVAASASSSTATDSIAGTEFSAPVALASDGTAGLNSATVYLYQRAASAPSVPSVNVTYTFSTGAATGQNNGWTQTLPTSGTNPIWVTTATAASNTATDTIATGEWATPAILAQNGTDGVAGANNAVVSLFNKNTSSVSAPSAFTGTATYTFSTGAVTGLTLNGWSTSVPAIATGEYLWVRQAVASSNTATDTIAIGEWSAAVILSNGGTNGLNTAPIFLYNKNTSAVTPPSAFTGTATYTFATDALTGLTLNSWARSAPSLSTGEYLWVRQAVASSNTATDTIDISEWSAAAVVGVAGTNGGTGPTGPTGPAGPQGTQALIAYGIGNSNYAFSGSTVVIGAATSPPANASIVYNFASGVEGFTASGGSSVSQSSDTLIWTAGTADSNLFSPSLGIPGASISKIRVRIRPTTANLAWEGIVYYATPGHGYSGSFYGVIPAPASPLIINTYYIVDVDMSNLGPNGGSDWINSTINSIRFDFSNDASTWQIDWIALGSNFAGTMPASGDWGLTTSWTPTPQTLTTNGTSLYQVTGLFNPTTSQAIWTGYPYLSSLKVGQLSAISADIGTITAGLIQSGTGGDRTEIRPQRIEVYASNVLRVRLGIWT